MTPAPIDWRAICARGLDGVAFAFVFALFMIAMCAR